MPTPTLYLDPFEGRHEFRVIHERPKTEPHWRCAFAWLCRECRLPLQTEQEYRAGYCSDCEPLD